MAEAPVSEPDKEDAEKQSNVRIYVRVKPVKKPALALSLDDTGTGVDFTTTKQGCASAAHIEEQCPHSGAPLRCLAPM